MLSTRSGLRDRSLLGWGGKCSYKRQSHAEGVCVWGGGGDNKFWGSFNAGTKVLAMLKGSGGATCYEVVLR